MSNTLHSNESIQSKKKKIIVLGSGPNRIGQGIEFDYCCVHGLLAVKEAGYEAIMVNCNPETVSTDFDMEDQIILRACLLGTYLGDHRTRATRRGHCSIRWTDRIKISQAFNRAWHQNYRYFI